MTEKNSEMSLDEVLSSIKKMVIDVEPPVLDLTDMVSDDGSITKIKKTSVGNKDMGAFLRLIQKNSDCSDKTHNNNNSSKQSNCNCEINPKEESVLSEMIKNAMTPILRKWVDDNLPEMVKEIVEKEIKNFLYKNQK
jgi:cell pole-organizing protein PopZ